MHRDPAVPDKVVDKAAPVEVADVAAVADVALTIPAERAPVVEEEAAEPASRATTRMAFTPRPWTTVIAPR